MTEAELQAGVVEMAHALGWRVAHFRPARTQQGWRTAVAYDAQGYPDLTLVRDRVVFVELKGSRGQSTEAQREWHAALKAAGAEVYLWGPDDWTSGEVDRVLGLASQVAA